MANFEHMPFLFSLEPKQPPPKKNIDRQGQKDRNVHRQAYRQRWTDNQTDRQTDRQA